MKAFFLSLLTTALFIVAFSCEQRPTDEITPIDSAQLIQQAQSYFDAELILRQQGARTTANQSWIKNKQPQWAQAVTFRFDNKEVVEVPLLLDGSDPVYKLSVTGLGSKGIITKRNGVTKALFFKQKDGTLKAFVMRLILDPDYLLVVGQNAKHKQLSIETLKNGFTGFLQLCSWDDALLDMYRYDKGKIIGSTRPRSGSSKGARVAACGEVLKWRWACVNAGRGCCTEEEEVRDPTGYCCGNREGVIDRNGAPTAEKHCEYVPYYEFECVPDEPIQPDPGSNGGSDPVDNSAAVKITIDPSVTGCYRMIVDKFSSDNTIRDRIVDAFTSYYREGNLNIKFVQINQPGQRPAKYTEYPEQTITLNTAAPEAQGSQELLSSVILHEMVHALVTVGNNTPITPSQLVQHEDIFYNWVEHIANTLQYYHPNIQRADAIALGLGGLGDFVTSDLDRANLLATQKYGMTIDQAISKQLPFALKDKGTACTN